MEEIVCKIRIGSTDCELELRSDGSLWLFVPGDFSGPFPAEATDAGSGVFFTAEDSRQIQALLNSAKHFLEENQ